MFCGCIFPTSASSRVSPRFPGWEAGAGSGSLGARAGQHQGDADVAMRIERFHDVKTAVSTVFPDGGSPK